MKKHKENRKAGLSDSCQTPPYALEPLYHYIPQTWRVWEPACGEGLLVDDFQARGNSIIGNDILYGDDFLKMFLPSLDGKPCSFECVVTNPPFSFSLRLAFAKHCYDLGHPFALLMNVDTFGSSNFQRLFDKHGMEAILLNHRVNFKMPLKGWSGSGSHFSVAWFTWGLNIGRQVTYGEICPVKMI